MTTLTLESRRPVELIDVTRQVREAIRSSGVRNGLALVFTPHTTAAVTINENADPDVVRDIVMELKKIVPLQDNYRHAEGNSAAHLKSSLIGASETLIVVNGEAQLGTWQGIYFCEFDGPRKRTLQVQVIGG
ncbi:MAG: secondary thiamine-phosphate synthase enzyme YjbQ [Trichloromonadaceae bacterium]